MRPLWIFAITDLHEVSHCVPAAEVMDMMQTLEFILRQADLFLAVGKMGKLINETKGRVLASWEMHNVSEKNATIGNNQTIFCDGETTLGYKISKIYFYGLETIGEMGNPVSFDATHSVQKQVGRAVPQLVSVNSSPALHARPARLALWVFSLKCVRSPTMSFVMVQT